jgi:hypothetical protein
MYLTEIMIFIEYFANVDALAHCSMTHARNSPSLGS